MAIREEARPDRSDETRSQTLDRLGEPYDLLVIGGGVNGLATAWDAALRGLRVAIVDKGDWGSGTSSWSSRLIHGGLKYLEHLEFGLVRESLKDREWLLKAAPHLVRPLAFIMPFYRSSQHGRLLLSLGMMFYDVLSFDKSLPLHRLLSRASTVAREPGLVRKGLQGSAVYYDAQVAYAERLCIELLLAARHAGAVALNYAAAESLVMEGPTVAGAVIRDQITGERHVVRATLTINATGPWIDELLQGTELGRTRLNGGTKGTHLVVDAFPGAPLEECVYYEAKSDGRQVLVIPWLGRYLIGSTDKRFTGELDRAMPDDQEVDYIISETNLAFPGANLTRESVRFAYTGVRPLPYKPSGSEGKITRKHIIHDHGPANVGLLTLIGGKLSTFRTLGEHAANAAMKRLRKRGRSATRSVQLPGFVADPPALEALLHIHHPEIAPSELRRLVAIYGARAKDVLSLPTAEPLLGGTVTASTVLRRAEVVFCIRSEQACRLRDVLARRTMMGLENDLAREIAPHVAELMANELGWNAAKIQDEVDDYTFYIERLTDTEGGETIGSISSRN